MATGRGTSRLIRAAAQFSATLRWVAIVCVAMLISLAPHFASADVSKSSAEERTVEERPLRRSWGERELIPRITLRSALESFLPDSVAEYNAATNKFARLRPRDIRRGIPVTGAPSRREAAERFLKTHHEKFGLSSDLAELRLEREKPASNFTRFTYSQLFQGLPVFGSSVDVAARTDALFGVSVTLIPISDRRQLPIPTDSAPAIKALIDDVGRRFPSPARDRSPPRAQLGVLVRAGTPACAWLITYTTKDETYRAYVDAETKMVLLAYGVRIYD